MAYRNDVAALEGRVAEIRSELEGIEAARRSVEGMRSREAELRRALSDAEARLKVRTLPVLEDVRIASPCNATWDAMQGDERVRFCGHCEKNVYNLSAMTREAALALLREKEQKVCVRLYRRADGTVITTDCPVGAPVRRNNLLAIAGVAVAASAACATMALATPLMGAPSRPVMGEVVTMGAVVAPAPQPTELPFASPPSDSPSPAISPSSTPPNDNKIAR